MASAVVPEVGYPHGHLGHLTADEDKALQDFKQLLAEKEIWKAGPPPSHDDQTLLRFLRARKFVVQDAFKQFKDTEDWRAANNLDILFDTIDIAAYEQTRQMYPQWIGRRDKRGIPVYLFQIRELDSKTVAEYEKSADSTYSKAHPDGATPPKLLRLFALYENLTRFVQPLCTDMTDRPHNQTPITLSTNIVDVSGVSLRQFWNLKSHMQDASQLATANYPETLDRIFIVGAPYFFSTVWGWIKRWFDPITVSKIFILSQSEVLPTLESFIDIENIPSQYGGKLEFKRGDVPNLDPAIRKAVTWEGGHTTFPPGPMYWRPRDDGRMECLAVGSIEQKDRKERIGTIPRNSNNKSTLAVVVEAEGVRTTAATPTGAPEDESKQLGGAPETTVAAAAPAPVAPVAPVAQVGEAPAPEVSPAPATATAAGTDAPAQASNPTIVVADTPTTETTSASGPVDGSVQGIQNLTLVESKKENTVAA